MIRSVSSLCINILRECCLDRRRSSLKLPTPCCRRTTQRAQQRDRRQQDQGVSQCRIVFLPWGFPDAKSPREAPRTMPLCVDAFSLQAILAEGPARRFVCGASTCTPILGAMRSLLCPKPPIYCLCQWEFNKLLLFETSFSALWHRPGRHNRSWWVELWNVGQGGLYWFLSEGWQGTSKSAGFP